MSVQQIHCPHCRADFIDSRAEWKQADMARCPKCGEQVAVQPAAASTTSGTHAMHVEPAAVAPIDED